MCAPSRRSARGARTRRAGNAKTAIIKASFYDPEVNRTYAEMAAHYRTAILPARPRKPRDKAKVEQAVLIVERWLLGRLRRRVFHSLADVDAALGEFMIQLNKGSPYAGCSHPPPAARGDRSPGAQGAAG